MTIIPFLQRLEAAGIPAAEVCRAGGVSNISSDIGRQPFLASRSLLRGALRAAPPGTALKLGTHWKVDYGRFSSLLLRCKTPGDMRNFFEKYYIVGDGPVLFANSDAGDEWRIELVTAAPFGHEGCLLFEDLISRTKEQLTDLTGMPMPFKRIELTYPAPLYHRFYENFLQCQVRFGRPRNLIVADRAILDAPVSADTSACLDAASISRHLRKSLRGTMSTQLAGMAVVRELLFRPGCSPSLESVASLLDVSQTTLKRWLSNEGTSFRLLCDDVRYDYLVSYFALTNLSAKEIAFQLGYADVHNFRRAVRRWSNGTLAALRVKLQQKAQLGSVSRMRTGLHMTD